MSGKQSSKNSLPALSGSNTVSAALSNKPVAHVDLR
jgi:hypothetical protein